MAALELALRAVVQNDVLACSYVVRNDGDRDVYLLNRLFTSSPPLMSPDIAYVELDLASRVIEVSKGLAELPPGISGPPVPVAPYVSPVRAGGTFGETVHIALPVRTRREYGRSPQPRPPGDEKIEEFSGVSFSVQWYPRAPGVTEVHNSAFGQQVIMPTGYRSMPPIEWLRSDVVALRIPVVLPPD